MHWVPRQNLGTSRGILRSVAHDVLGLPVTFILPLSTKVTENKLGSDSRQVEAIQGSSSTEVGRPHR